MKKLNTALMLSSILFLSACSTTRAPSINFLQIRSDYDGKSKLIDVNETSALFVPNRTKPQEVDIYVHPHETVHGDYFRGGYVRSIVKGGQWELTESTTTPAVQGEEKKQEPVKEVREPRIREFAGSRH